MTIGLTIAGTSQAHRTVHDLVVESGRDGIETQPDAASLTATVHGVGPEQVGDSITATDPDGQLFTGWVTDLDAQWNDDRRDWVTGLVATGHLAVLGQQHAGTVDYPQETDSARVARILDETGAAHAADPAIPGPQLLPRTAEPEYAADLARAAADDGMGVLWEDPADPDTPIRYTPWRLRTWGSIRHTWAELPADLRWNGMPADARWADLDSDRIPYPGALPALEIDPHAAHAELRFEQKIGDLARTVIVAYGVEDPEGGPRPTATAGSGNPVADLATDLATHSDAATHATTMLRRRNRPAWRLTSIRVDDARLQPADAAQLRAALKVGARLTIPLPLGSPVGTMWQGYLEGWRLELAPGRRSTTLNVSDRQLTEPATAWRDLDPALTWATIDPGLRWVDLTTPTPARRAA